MSIHYWTRIPYLFLIASAVHLDLAHIASVQGHDTFTGNKQLCVMYEPDLISNVKHFRFIRDRSPVTINITMYMYSIFRRFYFKSIFTLLSSSMRFINVSGAMVFTVLIGLKKIFKHSMFFHDMIHIHCSPDLEPEPNKTVG